MLTEFFQTGVLPANQFIGNYDPRLVALSYMVAVFASYIALDLTGRLRDRNNTRISNLLWLIGGSVAMGAGIWSMHFIGMLSFAIPGLSLQYDLFWTGVSLLVAIFASGFALLLLSASLIHVTHLIAGGIILGLGIASMHYTGMEGMLITLNIRYLPGLFFLSILVAIVASEAAIWLALKSNTVILRLRNRVKFGSATIMGLAICGMHYTGMASSVFTPLCVPSALVGLSGSLDPTILSMAIAAVTFIILGVAFFASNYKEASNQQEFEKARQLGMAEISASVLHNVGNVLNSVNVSVHTLSESITASKLAELEKLSELLNSKKDNLSAFIAEDPRGVKIVDFINELTRYWREEKNHFSKEIDSLLKNIVLIKDIISTQQSLSKNTGIENIISVNELVDEALLIIGLDMKKEVIVEKSYAHLHPILTDKVKLLQVLITLLRNAKDAVMESSNSQKSISIQTTVISKEKFLIRITDNGIGIPAKNIDKIFYYGFTTKQSGHGFGLHTTALAVNELGGAIQVKSDGAEKGTTFSVELPYKQPKA